jgi:hypothetical protein
MLLFIFYAKDSQKSDTVFWLNFWLGQGLATTCFDCKPNTPKLENNQIATPFRILGN